MVRPALRKAGPCVHQAVWAEPVTHSPHEQHSAHLDRCAVILALSSTCCAEAHPPVCCDTEMRTAEEVLVSQFGEITLSEHISQNFA